MPQAKGENVKTKAIIVDDFTSEERDAFWAQGVFMDDWDYALMVEDVSLFEEVERANPYYHPLSMDNYDEPEKIRVVACNDYSLDRLLTGCCSNKWYFVEYEGKRWAMGVAYHA